MRRRELLAGIGSAVILGGGAALAFGKLGGPDESVGVEPVDLDTVDAPGSHGETVTVPALGEPTFVEFFATWCTVCQGMMPEVVAAHDEVADDVQFLSVTNEPVGVTIAREEVAEWWEEHDGNWPVALDSDLELTERLDPSGVPYAYALDTDNHVVWEHRGDATADELLEGIRSAMDGA